MKSGREHNSGLGRCGRIAQAWLGGGLILAAGHFGAAAQAVANADLESGTFTSAGSFAGGTYQVFNNGTPQSWVRAIGAGDARWVNSTADHSPSGAGKYAYAYSTGDIVTGNDACLQNTLTGLTVGTCYRVSVFAAEAGGPVNNPAGNPGVMTLEFQNGPNASDFEYGRYFLPHNPAWSDSALTTIPWTQYSYTFTAKATSVVFWVSANAYSGVAGYMVADDVSVTAVPCGTLTYDYGDLPTAYNTTGGGTPANAPRHQVGATGTLRLGSTIDAEANGQPASNADGDDLATGPDEDGVTFPTLVGGSNAALTVKVTGPNTGKLNAWIDWNNDGDFADAGEQIANNAAMTGGAWNSPGVNTVNVNPVPAAAVKGTPLAARFRLSTAGSDGPTTGTAVTGEIEDYRVTVIGYDYGDLPDTSFVTTAQPRHQVGALRLGSNIDSETAGAGSSNADGDDLAGASDDEDGVIFPASIARGQVLILPIIVTGGSGSLNAWIDWNNNASFDASGEQIAANVAVTTGTNFLTVTVPASATIGSLGARFRLSVAGADARNAGTAVTGEIEDYRISVVAAVRMGNKVWEDTDNDGVMDAGTESIGGGINGVGVTVYAADPGFGTPAGFPLSSVNTVANGVTNGFYGFNLPPGDYVVVIPATNFASGAPLVGRYSSGTSTGTFNGIDPDTTATDRDDNGFNAINPASTGVRSPAVTLSAASEPTGETDLGTGEPIVTDNSSNLTVDFGFTTSTPTAIRLNYVKGWWQDGLVTVEWETLTELNTLGFDLYRLTEAGRVRVNADLVAALNVERGGVYRVGESMARPAAPVRYVLVEQETTGLRLDYGPFEITVAAPARVAAIELTEGTLELRFAGEPGAEYQIETTDDLVHGRWLPLVRVAADPEGWFRHRQPLPESGPQGFFRALRP